MWTAGMWLRTRCPPVGQWRLPARAALAGPVSQAVAERVGVGVVYRGKTWDVGVTTVEEAGVRVRVDTGIDSLAGVRVASSKCSIPSLLRRARSIPTSECLGRSGAEPGVYGAREEQEAGGAVCTARASIFSSNLHPVSQ